MCGAGQAFDGPEKPVQVNRLGEPACDLQAHPIFALVGDAGDDEHGNLLAMQVLPRSVQELPATHPWKHQIQNDRLWAVAAQDL
jgi:hypothetical protein